MAEVDQVGCISAGGVRRHDGSDWGAASAAAFSKQATDATAGQVGENGCQTRALPGVNHLDARRAIQLVVEPGGSTGRAIHQPGDVGAARAEELTISAQLAGGGDSGLSRARGQASAGAICPAG